MSLALNTETYVIGNCSEIHVNTCICHRAAQSKCFS